MNDPLIAKVSVMDPMLREMFLKSIGYAGLSKLQYMWKLWARPTQLIPSGDDWDMLLVLAGRGFGKTRMGAEAVRKWAEETPGCRIALIGQTAADTRDVMIEGESGILAVSPPWFKPEYQPSKRRVVWPNGTTATTFSADQPDQLRGPQFHYAWVDEFAKYADPKATWDQLQFGLRLGSNPKSLVTTTPRPLKILKEFLSNPRVKVVTGSTYDNAANLAKPFLEALDKNYSKTRLGRQELYGEVLADNEHALWRPEMFEYSPDTPELVKIVVGVDPSGGVDETGIIVFGMDEAGFGYVLADRTCAGGPQNWGRAVVTAFDTFSADYVVVEKNFGGDMAVNTIMSEAENMFETGERKTQTIPIQPVTASRGKVIRAEPVALMYEQGRIRHVGNFKSLEDELCEFHTDWNRAQDGSPNRLDALVWAVHTTMIQGASAEIRMAIL